MTTPSQTPHAEHAQPVRARLVDRTEDLVRATTPVSPSATNQDIFHLFERAPGLATLPVVEDDRPIGLINRGIFMQSLARPFHREVFMHKSCIAFMDKEPLVVEADTSVQDLSFKVLEAGDKVLADGYIVTRAGLYLGIGTAQDMLRAVAALQAEKNRMVMESIDYGSVIQRSLSRASRSAMQERLADHFLIWEPRDIVSGDFYYFQSFGDDFLLVLFDCTGHGVPGAFMTLIMSSFLQGAINASSARDPAALIAEMNRRVKTAMGQIDGHSRRAVDGSEYHSDDGMDAAFCWFDAATRTLTYSGAHMPLLLLAPDRDAVDIVDGDRPGVGYAKTPMDQVWTNHQLALEPGSAIYLFTDGLLDQPGGERRIAFGKRRLCATLLEHRDRTMPEVRAELLQALRGYQGDETRRDDVSAIGFRL